MEAAYYAGHRDDIIVQHKLWYASNRERHNEKARTWQANNSEHVKAYMRNYYLQKRGQKISAADPE